MQHFLYFLPLPQAQGSFRPILAISPTSFQRTDPVYQAVLADTKFHEQLLAFDRDLASSARAARCRLCGGALHSGRMPASHAAARPISARLIASASASAARWMAAASAPLRRRSAF